MTSHDLTPLPEFLRSQPWFSKKGLPVKDITVVDHCVIPTRYGDCLLAMVDVHYALGTPERFVLPLQAGAVAILPSSWENEFDKALFEMISQERAVPTARGTLVGRQEAGSTAHWKSLISSLSVRRCDVAQSNSSVVFNENFILKTFRRVEAGLNPELEMGRYLLKRQFAYAPPLLGSLGFEGSAPCSMALVHKFLQGIEDGWSYVTRHLQARMAASSEFLKKMNLMGKSLGELHRCLGAEVEDLAFAPKPLLQEDLQRWSASIIGELGVAISEAQSAVPALAQERNQLISFVKDCLNVQPSGMKIRLHGDLHLSQMLWTQEGWWMVDFEGEPDRPYAQRRAQHSPLKDVAGMMRSLEYAAAVTKEISSSVVKAIKAAFLDGYRNTVEGLGVLPTDETAQNAILKALELEKCVYELRYELHHRPEWVNIPAQYLLRELRF